MDTLHVSAEQFHRQLANLLNRVGYGKEQIIVERYGTPVAVLMSYKTYQNLPAAATEPAKTNAKSELSPFEQLPALAQEIEEARKQAGLTYETLAERLQAERLNVLRQKYPDFAAQYAPTDGKFCSGYSQNLFLKSYNNNAKLRKRHNNAKYNQQIETNEGDGQSNRE